MTQPPVTRPSYTQISRSHKGVDAQARQHERRRKLLEAGLETLGTKGFHTTTIRDVCGHAGLSERYFYESFSGLAELFNTVYHGMHVELLGRIMSVFVSAQSEPQDPMNTAEKALTTWFLFLKEDPRRARIMLVDAMGVNNQSVEGAQAATRDYVGAIQALVAMLYPNLSSMELSPRLLASCISGACIMCAREWVHSNFEAPIETVINHLMLVIRGLNIQYQRDRKAD
jgi:AcrR family transcriptional regulator